MKTSEIVRFAIANHLWDGKDLHEWSNNNDSHEFACCAIDCTENYFNRNAIQFEHQQFAAIKQIINRFINNHYTANNFVNICLGDTEFQFAGNPRYNYPGLNAAMQVYRKSMLELIAVYFESKGD